MKKFWFLLLFLLCGILLTWCFGKQEKTPTWNVIYWKLWEENIYWANAVYINTWYWISFTLSGDELSWWIVRERDAEEYDEKIWDIRKEHIILFSAYDEAFFSNYRMVFYIASLSNEQFDKLIQSPEWQYEWENKKIWRNNKYTFVMSPLNELHFSNRETFDLEDE